jgi:nucleoside-diphosphate-sugar epimerase
MEFASSVSSPTTILRLPKVYGRKQNADLASVFGFRDHPDWRWSHGHVGNVAAAIVLAATHPSAAGRIYNVGERHTPTIQERLDTLPHSDMSAQTTSFDFRHHLAYDTTRIRSELGYSEIIQEEEAMARTFLGETISELE